MQKRKRLTLFQIRSLIVEQPNVTAVQLQRQLEVKHDVLAHHLRTLMKLGFITRERDHSVPPFTTLYRYKALPLPRIFK